MTTYFYDVVVMGMEIGPLAAGALLAKRGFRVLVVGQSAPKDRYSCFDYQFTRRPFMLPGLESPALRRVVAELGMGQLFQHAVRRPDPVCQLILPRVRVNIHRSPEMLRKEVRRELPESGEEILEALERIGSDEHTLVFVTSDNGAHWLPSDIEAYGHRANADLRGQKADIWEGGHRVPFIAAWGDGTQTGSHVPPGSKNDQLIGVSG